MTSATFPSREGMDASSMGIEAICDGSGSLVKARLIVECNVKSL